MARPNARTPVIPLDFDLNIRAVRKELMIDYKNQAIYVVSPDDPNMFINITNKIKNEIMNLLYGDKSEIMDITNCQVTIEGVGTYLASEFLKILYQSQVSAVEDPDLGKVAFRQYTYDNVSVGINNDKVSINGFEGAPNGWIPIKKNNRIVWMSATDLQTPDSAKPHRYGVYKIDPVYESAESVVGMINLLEDAPIQESLNIGTRIMVNLPTNTTTDYCQIKWLVSTLEDENIAVYFSNDMIWAYSNDAYLGSGMVAVYTFETFDGGNTWLGRRQTYGNPKSSDDYVTHKELYNNFYTKPQVVDLISWDYDIDEDNDTSGTNPGNPSEGDIGFTTGYGSTVRLQPATPEEVKSLYWDIDFGDDYPADNVEIATEADSENNALGGTFIPVEVEPSATTSEPAETENGKGGTT